MGEEKEYSRHIGNKRYNLFVLFFPFEKNLPVRPQPPNKTFKCVVCRHRMVTSKDQNSGNVYNKES